MEHKKWDERGGNQVREQKTLTFPSPLDKKWGLEGTDGSKLLTLSQGKYGGLPPTKCRKKCKKICKQNRKASEDLADNGANLFDILFCNLDSSLFSLVEAIIFQWLQGKRET